MYFRVIKRLVSGELAHAVDHLFQSIILDHDAKPRHFGRIENPTVHVVESNPLCGDRFEIQIRVQEGVIVDIGCSGNGCVLSRASTSIMADLVFGKRLTEAIQFGTTFAAVLSDAESDPAGLPLELQALTGTRDHPSRVACALLPWRGLLGVIGQ